MEQPNAKLHQRISFIKSGMRIIAGYALICGNLAVCGSFIIVAELLGILEELV